MYRGCGTKFFILQHSINDCEMGGYAKAVSGQWLDKDVPTATDINAITV
jgi:hypothetical protein